MMSTDDRPTGYIPRLDALGRPVATGPNETEVAWPKYYPEEYDREHAERSEFDRQRSEESRRNLLNAVLDGLHRLDGRDQT